METDHRVLIGDARDIPRVADNSVELVVTSPPYPMIEMWDDLFGQLNPAIGDDLAAGDGQTAFDRMHAELTAVWEEVSRVLVDGGIACINIGDATRTLDDSFRVYQNHARVTDSFEQLGFQPLPEILWRKPTNSGAKFMGSGMLPPNAYATLEHEYLLIFRNGKSNRSFEPGAETRYKSAYFWEERNQWFSDMWDDINGELQELADSELRDRSAAYPMEIPYRLINMYSVYGDTVLDPFWGTGTTSFAAGIAGRNSIGCELDEEFVQLFRDRVEQAPEISRRMIDKRLSSHSDFVTQRRADGDSFEYTADNYDIPVVTKQEQPIQFYAVTETITTEDGCKMQHEAVDDVDLSALPDNSTPRTKSLSEF